MEESIDILILEEMRRSPDIMTLIDVYNMYHECKDIIFQYLNNFILEVITNDVIGIDPKLKFSEYLTSELLHIWVSGLINDFITEWLKTIDIMDDNTCYELLRKILKCSKTDCTFVPVLNETSFQITQLIWGIPRFRKVIHYFKNFVNGRDCMENDIFSSLMYGNRYNDNKEEYIGSVRELIDDYETHDSIINKILFTFDINKTIYSIGVISTLNSENIQNYADASYTNFLFRVLIEIYKKYDSNKIIEKILQSEDYEIDSHKINYSLPFEYKITLCMMYSIYFDHFLGCNLLQTLEPQMVHRDIEVFNRIVSRICDIDNKIICNFILDYEKIVHKIHDDEFIFDILNYLRIICSCKTLYDKLFNFPQDIYLMIEKIVTNKYGKIQINKHYRTDATKIMLLIIKKQGYTNFENSGDDVLLFVNDINYFEDVQYAEVFNFHKDIIQTLIISVKDLKSDDKILSNVLFKLLSKCGESFSIFDEILSQYHKRVPYEINGICCEIIGVINMTLYLYSEAFRTGKVTNTYQELNREFAVLVSKILDECHISNENIYKKLKQQLLAKNLIDAVIDCIFIVKNTGVLTYMVDYKSKFVELVNEPILLIQESKKNEILKILSECKTDDIIYPDEFLDPLLCVPIKSPVMIPDIKDFFDRTTIVTRIKTDPVNPYTRKPLTEEMFDEFNSKDEIKEKTRIFSEKFNEWKKQNNVSL
jgi:hypothetical protein